MIPRTLKHHHILFESRTLNEQLYARFGGEEPQLLGEFMKTFTMPPEGQVQLLPIGFKSADPSHADLSGAFSLLSRQAFSNRAWEEDFYLPYLSIGVMDISGSVYRSHISPVLTAPMIDLLGDDVINKQKYPSFSFGTLIAATINDELGKLVHPYDSGDKLEGDILYDPESTRLAINVSGIQLLLGSDRIYPVFAIQAYVVLLNKPLKPAIHKDLLLQAFEQPDPKQAIEKSLMVPVFTEEYREFYAGQDPKTSRTIHQVIDRLAYGRLAEGWGEHVLQTINAGLGTPQSAPAQDEIVSS
jgi:hypothetical protein